MSPMSWMVDLTIATVVCLIAAALIATRPAPAKARVRRTGGERD